MINPDDQIPLDDLEDSDKADQMSQQDVHSNGLDEERIPTKSANTSSDLLEQSYNASESAFTLNLNEDAHTSDKDKSKGGTID